MALSDRMNEMKRAAHRVIDGLTARISTLEEETDRDTESIRERYIVLHRDCIETYKVLVRDIPFAAMEKAKQLILQGEWKNERDNSGCLYLHLPEKPSEDVYVALNQLITAEFLAMHFVLPQEACPILEQNLADSCDQENYLSMPKYIANSLPKIQASLRNSGHSGPSSN